MLLTLLVGARFSGRGREVFEVFGLVMPPPKPVPPKKLTPDGRCNCAMAQRP